MNDLEKLVEEKEKEIKDTKKLLNIEKQLNV